MPDHCEGMVPNDHFSQQEVHVVETLKKGTRVTGADRSKLATALGRRYDSGESIRSLAASTGRSYGFVHRILTETGVTLRGRGGATRGGKSRVKH
jgi:Helix-turn-helix domain